MLSSPPKALLTLLKRQGDSAGGGGARATTPRFAGLLLGRNPEGRAPCPKGSQLCSWTKLGDRDRQPLQQGHRSPLCSYCCVNAGRLAPCSSWGKHCHIIGMVTPFRDPSFTNFKNNQQEPVRGVEAKCWAGVQA